LVADASEVDAWVGGDEVVDFSSGGVPLWSSNGFRDVCALVVGWEEKRRGEVGGREKVEMDAVEEWRICFAVRRERG